MTRSGRRVRHRQHGNPFNIRDPIAALDLEAVFGRTAPLAMDIGFGRGSFALELARRRPDWNVLGLEIRGHLVDGLNQVARDRGIANLHAVLANASMHLESLVPSRSVVFVAMYFPDPWFKRRHQKRS